MKRYVFFIAFLFFGSIYAESIERLGKKTLVKYLLPPGVIDEKVSKKNVLGWKWEMFGSEDFHLKEKYYYKKGKVYIAGKKKMIIYPKEIFSVKGFYKSVLIETDTGKKYWNPKHEENIKYKKNKVKKTARLNVGCYVKNKMDKKSAKEKLEDYKRKIAGIKIRKGVDIVAIKESKIGDVLVLDFLIARKAKKQFASAQRVYYFKNGVTVELFVEYSEKVLNYEITKKNLLSIKEDDLSETKPQEVLNKARKVLSVFITEYEKKIKKNNLIGSK